MSDKKEIKKTTDESLNAFLTKYRVAILSIAVAVIAAIVIYAVTITVIVKANEEALSKIDSITYSLTKESGDLSDADLKTRRDTAVEQISSYIKKGGIVGVRANMLEAELAFETKDYKRARAAWLAVVKAGKKSYTAPLAYYNAAVCSEELGDVDSAIQYYQKASDFEDFLLVAHSLFSLGRVKETKQDFKGAAVVYQKIVDKYPSDKWSDLAKSRLIALKADGKTE